MFGSQRFVRLYKTIILFGKKILYRLSPLWDLFCNNIPKKKKEQKIEIPTRPFQFG